MYITRVLNIRIFYVVAITMAMVACGHNNGGDIDPCDTVQVPEGVTGEDSIAYIENRVIQSPITADDLLGLAEVHSLEEYLFCYNNFERAKNEPQYADHFLPTRRDSCALRLANRFMRMHHLVELNGDAMDELQWALAVNAVLDTFRSHVPEVAPDAALDEIMRVMDKFSSMTQLEMNMNSYVSASVAYYRLIESYRQWLEAVPTQLKELAMEEYVAWYILNEARFDFWNDVSSSQEAYSLKPMEVEGYKSELSDNRRAELEIEKGIVLSGRDYKQQGRTVTTRQWEGWIEEHSVPDDIEILRELGRTELIPSYSLVAQRVSRLRTAFSRWLAARQALAAALPKAQGTAYDNLTADIHSRIIGQLPPIQGSRNSLP